MTDDTTAVREQHRFPQEPLRKYLCTRLPDFSEDCVFTVRQYRYGQSNPTFVLQNGQRHFILRKKPPGPLLPGAHKIDREYRVQKALFSVGFPVPQPLVYCDDVSVIGTEFYIMEHVEGRIFRDLRLPDTSPAERAALYIAAVETLARLHSLDLNSLDLQNYGKGEGYCKRQVLTWTKQYNAAAHAEIPSMNKLSDWLSNNVPSDDNVVTLVHGDFRLDNIIFHPYEARVLAVLDWELSTTGHPVVDLGYFLMPFSLPKTIEAFGTLGSLQGVEGIPAPAEIISIYCRCRHQVPSLITWHFFQALALFKMAGIAQGIYARYLLGNASAENAYQFGDAVEHLAKIGLEIAERGLFKPDEQSSISEDLFKQSSKGKVILSRVKDFIQNYVFPVEKEVLEYYEKYENSPMRWKKPEVIQKLKAKARLEGLWNLFLPAVSGLTQLDYAFIAEETGKCFFAPDVFNCQAPDTGNMEVLHLYGTEKQKQQWLEPLLNGDITSCFCMTEPDTACSDATNVECSFQKDGECYVINGKKWWSSGAGSPDCKIAIVMGRMKDESANRHRLHSMILVPLDTPGVKIVRALKVFGYDDAFHGGHFEIHFDNVHVPKDNMILGEGRGFEIAQGRLGPGRLHHCMRTIGLAERALELLCQRAIHRKTFGKKLYQHEVIAHWIAECRIGIEQARLLTLNAANSMDKFGSSAARKEIAMIKIAAARMACKVVDCAIQVHGGGGVSQDFPLAQMYSLLRTLRIADGPDEVHLSAVAKMELRDQLKKFKAKI